MKQIITTASIDAKGIEDLARAQRSFPPIWVIYDHPRDFPDHVVIRIWYGLTARPEALLTDSLEAAREQVQREGASVRMARAAQDDPSIAETWI